VIIRELLFSVYATLFLFVTPAASAADRYVPDEYSTIQAAVNASAGGDSIIVKTGTYYEKISVNKDITLTSTDPNDPGIVANTIINAGGSGSAVTFFGSETAYYELRGFTVTGADNGGIKCGAGNITIRKCIITNNKCYGGAGKGGGISNDSLARLTVIDCNFIGNIAGWYKGGYGGGIFSDRGALTVIGCEFIQNSARIEGGGVATDYNQVTIRNCIFRENDATYGGAVHNSHYPSTIMNCTFTLNSARYGGAICEKELYLGDHTHKITNCTFYDNYAEDYGGAVSIRLSGNLVLTNCILWENIAFAEGPQISGGHTGDISISYCCIQGGHWDIYAPGGALNWLEGNIEIDPVLANPAAGDFHLQSTEGRWDTNINDWVYDTVSSPCIDTGDPKSDWTAEPWPNGQRINMGAFGGTSQASKSPENGGCIADFDDSGAVDEGDLKLLTEKWLIMGISLREDLYGDGTIDLRDFAVFAKFWGWHE